MKKRFVKTLITTFVMSSLVVTPVLAEPGEDAQSIEAQKEAVEAQAADMNTQLVDLIVRFDALKQDMAAQEEKIAQAEARYAEAQQKEAEQYEAMKLRIKYLYEQGDTSAMEAVLDSESYTDMINKSEYFEKIHEYDRKMLKKYTETKEEVATSKAELESGRAEMEAMAVSYTEQQATMENTLSEMKSQISDFDSQLAAAQEQAAAQLGQLTEDTRNMTASLGNQSSGNGGNNSTKPSQGNQQNPNNQTNTNKPSNPTPPPQPSNPTPPPSNASLGQQIANTACQYIGNKYEYGGNSLTNGVDCSGFVQQIHLLFGISTPRNSWGQLAAGKAVNYGDMLPGDIIVYSDHVAIYIGGNTVVHASNSAPYPSGGIKKTSPANYRTVLGVRRYW